MFGNKHQCMIAAASAVLFATSFVTSTSAATRWQASHPRRVEVNHRLDNLNAGVHQERRDGQLTAGQAHALHAELHQIRREERGMAHLDNSHITRAGQRSLNQQENGVSAALGW